MDSLQAQKKRENAVISLIKASKCSFKFFNFVLVITVFFAVVVVVVAAAVGVLDFWICSDCIQFG